MDKIYGFKDNGSKVEAPTKDEIRDFTTIIPFFGILRVNSNGWYFINDDRHMPLNLSSDITIKEDNPARLIINHPKEAGYVYNFSITSDETFTSLGIFAGASVGVDHSEIEFYINTTASAYLRISGDTIVPQDTYSFLFKEAIWDSTNGQLSVYFNDNLAIACPNYWTATIQHANGLPYDIVCSYGGNTSVNITLYDKETGTQITNLSAFDRLLVKMDYHHNLLPADFITHSIDGSNFWISGWLKK